MKNIAVFASGTGSNFLAINESINSGSLKANLAILVSDKPFSKAVENATILGIKVLAFNPKEYSNKKAFEEMIVESLQKHNVDLIVLAGYMRLIGETLLKSFQNRIINIHPSLLPKYKGLDAIGQALNDDASETGVTVHYVDEGMDTGTIIAQESLVIFKNETREHLENRVHAIEHKLYPKTINKVLGELK